MGLKRTGVVTVRFVLTLVTVGAWLIAVLVFCVIDRSGHCPSGGTKWSAGPELYVSDEMKTAGD
jgi:hypothetical protein